MDVRTRYNDQTTPGATRPSVLVDRSDRLMVDAGAGAGSRLLDAGTYTDVRFRQIEAFGADVTITSAVSEAFDGGADLAGKTLPEGQSISGIITAITFTGGPLLCYA